MNCQQRNDPGNRKINDTQTLPSSALQYVDSQQIYRCSYNDIIGEENNKICQKLEPQKIHTQSSIRSTNMH